MNKKEYFIINNGVKEGAFTFEELKQKDIYDTTLIWKAGWEDWKVAKDVEEMKTLIIATPPPSPKEKQSTEKREAIKSTIKNTSSKTLKVIGLIVGIFFLTASHISSTT